MCFILEPKPYNFRNLTGEQDFMDLHPEPDPCKVGTSRLLDFLVSAWSVHLRRRFWEVLNSPQ
jgi:hypothetical protein